MGVRKMIIVLGFDNTGKSTLSHTIAKDFDRKVINSLGPVPKSKQVEFMNESIENEGLHERFPFFEELVYGPILREESNFNFNEPIALKLKLKEPTIVYCRPPREEILNWGQREQMDGVIEGSIALLNAWDELMFHLIADDWNVLPYDWTQDGAYNELKERIKQDILWKSLLLEEDKK